MFTIKKIYLLTAIYLISSYTYAQKENYIWQFGVNSGFEFNNTQSLSGIKYTYTGSGLQSTNTTIQDLPTFKVGYVNTSEGCFSICDKEGNLLLASDGTLLYDRNGNVLNTTSLGGDPSATQSGIIVPNVKNDLQYFIFTVNYERKGNIQYALVEMNPDGETGVIKYQNRILKNSAGNSFISDENIAAVPNPDGSCYWVLNRTQPVNGGVYGVPKWRSWRIDGSVNEIPVFDRDGYMDIEDIEIEIEKPNNNPLHTNYNDFIGELVASADGTRLALLNFGTNFIHTMEFNPSTGDFSLDIPLRIPLPPDYNIEGSIYGGTFSPNGNYFYFATITGSGIARGDSRVISWDDMRAKNLSNMKRMLPLTNIKAGPYGRLYCIKQTKSDDSTGRALYVIEDPDSGSNSLSYFEYFFPAANTPRFGLPNFPFIKLHSELLSYSVACLDCPREIDVEYTVSGTYPPVKIEWNFGDGTPVVTQNVTTGTHIYTQKHTFSTPGKKNVVITPIKADGTRMTTSIYDVEVFPCAIKTNRMIRTSLKNLGEP